MNDPAPPCARRGMAVRVPPRGRRVLTYPWPPRPGRRVSIVCVPRNGRKITSDPAPCQRRRVMAAPSPRLPTWRGMTVRAPPSWHRVPTYPWPARPGRRVSTVRVPWQSPPSPCRPACAGCARRACPTTLPIPAPTPTRTPTKTLSTPTPGTAALPGTHNPAQAAIHPSPHGGEGPGVRSFPPPPPTKCILPSKFRPNRGRAPPRTRASLHNTPPAPPPRPPAEYLSLPAARSPASVGCDSGGTSPSPALRGDHRGANQAAAAPRLPLSKC